MSARSSLHGAVIALALVCPAAACAGSPLPVFAWRPHPPAWQGAFSAAVCAEVFVVASTAGIFATRDGTNWRRESLPRPIRIPRLCCVYDTLYAVGQPGVARRTAVGDWVLEHYTPLPRGPDSGIPDHWQDPAFLTIEPASLSGRPGLRIYGLDPEGRPRAMTRTVPDGTWRREDRAPRRDWSPLRLPPECRAPPTRQRRTANWTVRRAVFCGDRIGLSHSPTSSDIDEFVPLPSSVVRERGWSMAGIARGDVFLARSTARRVHGANYVFDVLRYGDGRWSRSDVISTRMLDVYEFRNSAWIVVYDRVLQLAN